MVTGPVVALAAMALGITQHDGFAALRATTAVASLLQLGFASLRLGRLVQIVHPAILERVLGSIGLVLVLFQLHVLCASAPTANLRSSLVMLPRALAHAEVRNLLIAAVTIGIVLLWNCAPGHRLVPSMLVAIVAGLALLNMQDVRRVHMPSDSWRAALPGLREGLHRPEIAYVFDFLKLAKQDQKRLLEQRVWA